MDAPELYTQLYDQAAEEAEAETLGWLASAGFGYQALRAANARRVTWMSRLSAALAILMVAQTLSWLTGLAID